jgi:3-hydroxybutyryl-CoA dehydrogenase
MAFQYQDIRTVGVVGAGLMGVGIAQVLATSGYDVVLIDLGADAVNTAIADIRTRLAGLADKQRLSEAEANAASQRRRPAAHLSEMSDAQLVIEAVVERIDVKQALFQQLEGIVSPDTILATNTSSLSIAAIGKALTRRERICGMHFFNPVPVMRLVEIIPGYFTDAQVVETLERLTLEMKKVSVRAKDGPGFLVNLGGRAFITEALHIVAEQVATPEQIDRIMTESLGFRMGPFELSDFTGIDTNLAVTTYIHQGHQFDPRLKTVPFQERLVEAGRFGRKSGGGYYDYPRATADRMSRPTVGPQRALLASLPEAHPCFDKLGQCGLAASYADDTPILVSPRGEDATSMAVRLSLDPQRVVAIDFTGLERRFLTVMTPPVASRTLPLVLDRLQNAGYAVEVVSDSPAFVAPRILAMIVNLASEMAQTGVASPDDIETAMQLGLNYPEGPLAMGNRVGAALVLHTLQNLQAVTGSDRYRPSLWLRRRAQLGVGLAMITPPLVQDNRTSHINYSIDADGT